MLALLGALIIGLSLGLFGSGGSILTVPVLLYLLKMPAELAIASSLLIVAGISLLGSAQNAWQKRISWRHVLWFGIPGMVGTYGGAWLGTLVDSRWQLLCFALLMLVAAVMMWRNRQTNTANQYPFNDNQVFRV
ncbi:sulfite exporter TauE/SafE family protein [Alishewanella longhuensis]